MSTIAPVLDPVSLHSAVYIELGLKQNFSGPDSLKYTHSSLQESGNFSTEASVSR